MFRYALGAIGALFVSVAGANAGTIDFEDANFGTADPNGVFFATITEVSDGVTFAFTSTSNLVGGPRWLGSNGSPMNGLQLGGGGGSTLAFTLTVDTDVRLVSYTLRNQSVWLGSADFDILDGLSILSEDNTLAQSTSPLTQGFASGPIALTAGTVYTFDVNGTSAAVQAGIAQMEFTTAAVPLPAAFPLLAASLGSLIVLRRRSV